MNNNKAISIISSVFFLSGCSALIFEATWFRVASTVLGSSVWSAAAVLMAFMGGLAIGNGLMAIYGHRVHNPARFYLVIEALIGISGFTAILLLPKLSPLFGNLLSAVNENPGILSAGRFAIACLFLTLPASAMGATLPVMQKLASQYDESFMSSIARLYGWNTIGAVSGVLLAEFFLIKYLGILSTAAFACTLNLMVVFIVFKAFGDTGKIVEQTQKGRLEKNIIRYLLAAFFAGMLLLALEMVWFRYLLVAREGSTIIFAVMLAVILIGIGLGGLLFSRLKLDSNRITRVVFFMPVAASIVTISGFFFFQAWFDVHIQDILGSIPYFVVAVAILIFPTSFISGMIFPLLGECIFQKNQVGTASSGYLTMANTIGAFIGSAIATFYLLPVIGIELSILVIAVMYLLLSLLLLEKPKTQLIYASATLILIVVLFPHGLVKQSFERVYAHHFPNEHLVRFHEGLNETIAYLEKTSVGKRKHVRLVTNNHSMSATALYSQRYMRLYSYFPYLFPHELRDVLQISYGVGVTAESIILLPDMERFDIVDMSSDVLALSTVIHDETGYYPLRDKRSVAHIEDGRFFLQTTSKQYDLVTAEPPPPLIAGVVNLYSQEYFQLIHDVLRPGGISTYWLPVHQFNELGALSTIKAFCNVFSDCSLWNGGGLEFMMVGSKSGLGKIDQQQLQAKWQPGMASEFSMIGFENPAQVFATYLADRSFLADLTVDIQPLTDNYPSRLDPTSFNPGSAIGLYSLILDIERRKESFLSSPFINSIFSQDLVSAIHQEFGREGIVTLSGASLYEKVLIGENQNYWDLILDQMSNEKRDFVLLQFTDINPGEMENMHEAFNSEASRKLYTSDYAKYLFLEKNYEQLEAAVAGVLYDDSINLPDKSLVHHLYVLAKLHQGTATLDDIILSMEMSQGLQDDGFNIWFVAKLAKASNDPGPPG